MATTRFNPFGQEGWNNGHTDRGRYPPPSVVGALPSSLPPVPPIGNPNNRPTFQFINPSTHTPSILNCNVLAPFSSIEYRIVTDDSVRGYTTFKDKENRPIASIEWTGPAPSVEIRNTLSKTPVREWLAVTHDTSSGRRMRSMDYNGSRYYWLPHGDDLHLYPHLGSPANIPCAIARRHGHAGTLEISPEFLQRGLLEPCVVAVVLLLSGRRID